MKRLSTFLTIALLVAVPIVAAAQEQAAEEKDALEVGLRGGLGVPAGGITSWNDSLGAKVGWNVGFEVGYFLTREMVLGVGFSFNEFGIDTKTTSLDMKHRLYTPKLYLKRYFFGESNWVPYAKVYAGLDFPKFATFVVDEGTGKFRQLSYNPGFAGGVGAGVFYYTSDYGGLFAEAEFQHGFTKNVTKTWGGTKYTFGESSSALEIRAGINVFFGSGQ